MHKSRRETTMRIRPSLRFGALSGAVVVVAVAAYVGWAHLFRAPPAVAFEPRVVEVLAFGDDQGQGALVALQPWMVPADFASAERLFKKLDAELKTAEERGVLDAKSVVVLPE